MIVAAEIDSFLKDAGWDPDAPREALVPDGSTRRFYRLTREDGTPRSAILMTAPLDQKTDIYVHLSLILRRLGISAPDIYASDFMRGLALMEDFGGQSCGAVIDAGEAAGDAFDADATAILARLHDGFNQTMLGALRVPLFNSALFVDQVCFFLDHYFPHVFHRLPTPRERSDFVEAWYDVLAPLDAAPRSLLLRDYMPDNAMVLPAPLLGHKIGILDFQDAGLGPVAYDLASWCEEVRRDGGLARLESMVRAYCALRPEMEFEETLSAARILAAQRHTRILGIMVSLGRHQLLPRTFRTLQTLLKDDALRPVRRWFATCGRAAQ